MTPLDTLIERLGAVTGPDRELDAEIAFDMYASPVGVHKDGGPRGYLWPEDHASWSFGIRFPGKDREWFKRTRKGHDETLVIERDGALVLVNSLRVLPYTGSVDAAMSVADRPGWRVLLDKRPGAEHRADGWRAQVYREGHPYKSDMSDMPTAWAKTAPLALVIAALKASRPPSDQTQQEG